ncbi:undecaprenyl-phosphate glucose phosphotransferase [Maritalea myrionectae]|uniref:UDP-glucose:undecaprenyl-phosphate glucose-1-phosphate transferase n=1 Tax=Maritalea myrionectae TaxID=454601 RepID=A0A2R4MFN7_9HYPH|nr:undecaprenyl-phosphate glucose phosphotransferase [Maritalea myrionectae]AVX04783.1 UDP-glucose:undecaprenyl-phosphate glucose-1-phosphate transferase [Maritalea myrionectae]
MFRIDPKRVVAEYVGNNRGNGDKKLTALAQKIADAPVEPAISSMVIVGTVQAIETALLGLLGFIIYFVYVGNEEFSHYAALIGISLLISLFAFNIANSHEISVYRTRIIQTSRAFGAWSATLGLVLVGLFLVKLGEYFSRVWLVSWFGLGALTIVVFRYFVREKVMEWTGQGRLKRRTVIVGGGHEAEFLIESIRQTAVNDIELLGMFDDRADKRSPDIVADCPKLGKVADLLEFARQTRVDLIIVSLPVSAEARVLHMVKQLWVLPVDIRLSAHMSKLKFKNRAYSFLGDVPVFDMADRPISDWNLVVKWIFDKSVALFALLLFSPVMLITAIMIKLDSKGPVFFKQKRHGFNNELIEVYKFRSMYTDMSDAKASKLVTKDDPRVTKVGRFIRKTSLDELPQFLNVLRGELSICGPRPHALQAKAANELYHDAVDGYFARHRVKPGITGWAQIHGWRGETDTTEKLLQRVSHDLHYIENWSIFMDIYILFMTPISLVSKSEGAY